MPKAKAAAERALQLDPNLAEAHASLGLIAPFLNGNWAEAKEQYERAIELNPNYATAHHWYAEGYLIPRGEWMTHFSKSAKRRNWILSHRSSQPTWAKNYILLADTTRPLSNFAVHWISIQILLAYKAFLWLEKAYDENSSFMTSLKFWSVFDGLRSNPRFVELLRRVGLRQ